MRKTVIYIGIVGWAMIFASACTEKWDEHYNDTEVPEDDNLYAALLQYPELSTFVRLVEIAGLKEAFSGPDAYTVWAPENAALSDIRLDNLSGADSLAVTGLIYNHLARSNHSTAEIEYGSKRIFVLNMKKIPFVREETRYLFGEKELNRKNIRCSNGVLHTLKERVPVQPNHWEILRDDVRLSEIKQALSVYDTVFFDLSHSREIGLNDYGESVYDSVLTVRNRMLDKIGPIYDEDSTFTCIFPSNTAYAAIFAEYRPYFVSNGGADGTGNTETLSKQRTDSAIFNNLIFRGDYHDKPNNDSILNTTGTVFYRPQEIFNSAWIKMSNGWSMITDRLNMPIGDTYYRPLVRVPELLSYGKTGLEYIGNDTRQMLGYPHKNSPLQGVSGSFFRLMEGEGGKPVLCIYFGPKILSAKYDIYCTLIPPIVENPLSEEKGTIIDFGAVYNRGVRSSDITNPTERLLTGYKTDPTKIDAVLVKKGFQVRTFDGNPGLTITVNVPASQLGTYGRSARIYNVILIPSEEE